ERADDEGVARDLAAAEPRRRGGAGHHHDLLALATAQHVEGHDEAAAAGLDFEEGARRNMLDALRGPVPAYDMTADHRRILSIVILRLRALSRASGVTAISGPTCRTEV